MYEDDFESSGFEWVDINNWTDSLISFQRKSKEDIIIVVCNFTPVPRMKYRLGVPAGLYWKEVLNSDKTIYGGSGLSNDSPLGTESVSCHNQPRSLSLDIPPLAMLILKEEAK